MNQTMFGIRMLLCQTFLRVWSLQSPCIQRYRCLCRGVWWESVCPEREHGHPPASSLILPHPQTSSCILPPQASPLHTGQNRSGRLLGLAGCGDATRDRVGVCAPGRSAGRCVPRCPIKPCPSGDIPFHDAPYCQILPREHRGMNTALEDRVSFQASFPFR